MLVDHLEHRFSGRALREQSSRTANRKRKKQIGARRVPEVQLGHRERDVVLCNAQYLFRVALRVEGQVVMKMNRALRVSSRAGCEQPNRYVVATRPRGLELV